MLELVEKSGFEELSRFCADDPFGLSIVSAAEIYGTQCPFCNIWLQKAGGKTVGAVLKLDSTVTLHICGKSDMQELREFVNTIGFNSLIWDDRFSAALGISPDETGDILCLTAPAASYRAPGIRVMGGCERDFRDAFSLMLGKSGETDFAAWYTDAAARINKGVCTLEGIYIEQTLASVACVSAKAHRTALISGVHTLEKYRGKGFASALVSDLAEKNNDKKIYLFTASPEINGFYFRLGFTVCGRRAQKGSL
ncbi:MAG: GNAT family N-acetyltransferase [Clostridiales bacterium]|nr:GNAT family N-acetyltransferase [Clostridiales bacterium]